MIKYDKMFTNKYWRSIESIMEKTSNHTHRHHRHRPWYKKIGNAWQEIPISRRRKYMKFMVGFVVCVLSVLLGMAIVYLIY